MTRDGKPDPKPRVKKSETLEVRIPYETKQAFLNACREDGTNASEVVREQVQNYLAARERSQQEEKRTLVMHLPQNVRRYGPRVAAGGIAAIGLTALAVLPSAADPDFKAQFTRLDANGDGQLSVDEFIGPQEPAGDKAEKNVTFETRTMTVSRDDSRPAPPPVEAGMKKDAFTFLLPEELGSAKAGEAKTDEHREFKFVSRHEVRNVEGADAPEAESKAHSITFNVEDLRKEEFADIDINKDGKVSLGEYQARQTAMLTRGFEILDGDKDQSLSREEYARIVAPPMVMMKIDGMPDAPEPPKVEIPGIKASPEALDAAFKRLDANDDGKLSLQEYLPKA